MIQNSPEQQQPVVVQKQRFNVYTMMLILAFLAICVSILLLYLELNLWGEPPWWNTSGAEVSAVLREGGWSQLAGSPWPAGSTLAGSPEAVCTALGDSALRCG